jgi:hypothetical protein
VSIHNPKVNRFAGIIRGSCGSPRGQFKVCYIHGLPPIHLYLFGNFGQ